MSYTIKTLAIVILVLGAAGVILGGVFIGLGMSSDRQLKANMRAENVNMGIVDPNLKTDLVDTLSEAMQAGDKIRQDRHQIAPNYDTLLGGGRFDPTNPKQLSYAQAMNLENYLYLAVVAFGLTQAMMGTGAFMILTGLATGATGIVLLRLSKT
jgi:hypothetical protein